MPDRATARMLATLVAAAMLVAAYAPTFGGALEPPHEFDEAFFFNPYPTTPWLNALLAIAFLALRRRRLARACAEEASRPVEGGLLLGLGIGLHAWSHFTGAPDLDVLSVLATGAGLALWLGGGPLLRATGPTLPLLALAWPLPAAMMNALIPALQILARDGATLLLLPVLPEVSNIGDFILHGSHHFRVIESCSGTRSLWTMQLAALAYGELLSLSPKRRVALCLAAVPIALVLNAVRIAVIVLFVDGAIAEDHKTQGLVAIVAGVIALHLVNELTERRGQSPAASEPGHTLPRGAPPRGSRVRAAIAATIALALAPVVVPEWSGPASSSAEASKVALPTRAGDWSARRRYLDEDFLGSIGFSQILEREYYEGEVEASPSVRVLIAHHDRIQRRTSVWSPRWRRASSHFDVVEQGTRFVEPLDRTVTTTINEGNGERRLVWSGFIGSRGVSEETLRALSGLDRSPWRSPHGITAFRFETTIPPGIRGPVEANQRLERFVSEVGRGIVAPAPSREMR